MAMLNNQRVYVIDYYKVLMIIYDDGWNHLNPPWILAKSPWTLAWRSSLKDVSTLGNWRNIQAANAWENHGKSMKKTMENHDDMDISLSELGTNPAVVNHIWGTSSFQQPKWLAILCNMLTHPISEEQNEFEP